MNLHAVRAIYLFEMNRAWRTLLQSIASPVISTSLYFVVFGSAIGSKMVAIDGISYGAFIIPGLVMLALLTESISNAAFGIFFPKYNGTIYELLSAPVALPEILLGYVGAAASKSIIIGLIMLATALCRLQHRASLLDARLLGVNCGDLQFIRFHYRRLGRRL